MFKHITNIPFIFRQFIFVRTNVFAIFMFMYD